ncbi:MAG: tRNA pseudouridine(55) synthase TruB [bacterium]
MARRRKGRPVDGVLILNKPLDMSSNGALQKARYLFFARKAGHTGSLDPLATGVLPVCFGEATKFTGYLLDADKRYRATFRFGRATASGDADSEITSESGSETLQREDVEAAIESFRGDIEQVPSMYSAIKHEGKPLYELARSGIEVERKSRAVTIYDYRLLDFRPGKFAEADVEVHCSKGTYIRTLADDLGKKLGCGAYVIKLHRTAAGPFSEEDAVDLEALEQLRENGRAEELDRLLLPIDAGMEHLPSVALDESSSWYFQRGQAVMLPGVYHLAAEGDIVRVFQSGGPFLGLAEVTDDGRVTPRRLVSVSTGE